MKLLLPDPCWHRKMLSGALFLYFHDEPIATLLHASVSTFQTGIDPFEFFRMVEERQPIWIQNFIRFRDTWHVYRKSMQDTKLFLEPLREPSLKSIWLIYERGSDAWESASELLASSSLAPGEIYNCIDTFVASDELFAHMFFNKYLELYYPDKDSKSFFEVGGARASAGREQVPVQIDWAALYDYCDQCFTKYPLGDLLTRAYMFRIPVLQQATSVLLSNERLIDFLASLPVTTHGMKLTQEKDGNAREDPLDSVAWEFFRQLVSPLVDPLDRNRMEKIHTLLKTKEGKLKYLRIGASHWRKSLAMTAHLAQCRGTLVPMCAPMFKRRYKQFLIWIRRH
jgi:hypothetical protein